MLWYHSNVRWQMATVLCDVWQMKCHAIKSWKQMMLHKTCMADFVLPSANTVAPILISIMYTSHPAWDAYHCNPLNHTTIFTHIHVQLGFERGYGYKWVGSIKKQRCDVVEIFKAHMSHSVLTEYDTRSGWGFYDVLEPYFVFWQVE